MQLCGGCGLVAKSYLTLVTPWTVARQAPLSVGFFRQEYGRGLPFPSPGDLPDSEINPCLLNLLHRQTDSLTLSHLGGPLQQDQNNNTYFCFTDYAKAFFYVYHNKL